MPQLWSPSAENLVKSLYFQYTVKQPHTMIESHEKARTGHTSLLLNSVEELAKIHSQLSKSIFPRPLPETTKPPETKSSGRLPLFSQSSCVSPSLMEDLPNFRTGIR